MGLKGLRVCSNYMESMLTGVMTEFVMDSGQLLGLAKTMKDFKGGRGRKSTSDRWIFMVRYIIKSGRNYLDTLWGSRLNVTAQEKNGESWCGLRIVNFYSFELQ